MKISLLVVAVALLAGVNALSGCQNYHSITGLPYELEGTTAGAPYTDFSCDLYLTAGRQQGVWFNFIGNNKMVTANLCDDTTDYDTVLILFTACNNGGNASSCMAVNDDSCDRKSQLTWHAVTNVLYHIFVTGYDVSAGHFKLEVVEEESPSHDSCTNAVQIGDGVHSYYATGNTELAIPAATSCRTTNVAGLWYRFTGSGSPIKVHTCDASTNFDTVIEIYSGCTADVPSGCVTYNDDSCGTQSAVVFVAEQDQYYWIVVGGYAAAKGTYFLTIEPTNSQPHYSCDRAVAVTTLPYTNFNTNKDVPVTFSPCNRADVHALYYRVHGTGMKMVASTCALNNYLFDTVVAVYDTCVDSEPVTCLTWNDDFCGIHSHVEFNTTTDRDYYIMVAGFRQDVMGGNFTITIDLASNLENDKCWGAEVITLPFATAQDTYVEPTTVGCNVDKPTSRTGRWFKYVNSGTTEQVLAATTCLPGTTAQTAVEVYTDCGGARCVAGNTQCGNQSNTHFTAEAGKTYYIFVATTGGDHYFELEIYENAYNSHSVCSNPNFIRALPYKNSGETMTSSLVYSDCQQVNKKGEWFSIVGTGNKIVAHTCDAETDYNTELDIYSDCKTEPGPVDVCLYSNDDFNDEFISCDHKSYVSFQSQTETAYFIFVTGSADATGVFRLDVVEEASPLNANCFYAEQITVLPYSDLGYTTYANPSNGSCAEGLRRGMWYQFTAEKGKSYVISTCDDQTDYDTAIEIYTACNQQSGGLNCVGQYIDDNTCTPKTHIVFTETKDTQSYYIFVTGVEESDGFFYLTVDYAPTPSSSSGGGGGGGLSGGAKAAIVICVLLAVAVLVAGGVVGYMYYTKRLQGYLPLRGDSGNNNN